MDRLKLSDDVFFCTSGGTYVLLNVASDGYFRLTKDQSLWFDAIMENSNCRQNLSRKEALFAERLLNKGILTSGAQQGRAIVPAKHSPATSSAYGSMYENAAAVPVSHFARFVFALIDVWILEKRKSFLGCISNARLWKARTNARSERPHSAEVRELAKEFHAIAPIFITEHDACRFSSVLLLRYLSLFSISADWIFGVRMGPFAAHCWIEHDGVVLNDYLESTRGYSPIMVV